MASALRYGNAPDGTRLPNLGEKRLNVVTEDGDEMTQTFQVADVTRPLSSVGEITDKGNIVVFGRSGGYIWNPQSRTTLPFQREQGVYQLQTWIQEPNAQKGGGDQAHFGRQG